MGAVEAGRGTGPGPRPHAPPPAPTESAGPAEAVSDYARFSFDRMWAGRQRVTEVERALLTEVLAQSDARRVLEIGTGFGRLLPAVRASAHEVVATDFDRDRLARLEVGSHPSGPLVRVAANLYHLPFADSSFTAVTLVRVYHHLDSPIAALREVARVLAPGGTALVSYNPRPSVGTVVYDLRMSLHPPSGLAWPRLTFARNETVALPPDPFPVYARTRARFDQEVSAAGLLPSRELGTGLEEFALLKHLPAPLFVGLARALGPAPGFPMRFAVLRRPGRSASLPASDRIYACPRCRAPLVVGLAPSASCGACRLSFAREQGVWDLRYVPPGTRTFEAALPPAESTR